MTSIKELLDSHISEGNKTQGDTWKALRQAVLERDGYVCQECGGKANTVHHNEYGVIGERNLVSLCPACHMRQHGLNPDLSRTTDIKRRLEELKREMEGYDSGMLIPFMTPEARWLMPDIKANDYWVKYLRNYYIHKIKQLKNELNNS